MTNQNKAKTRAELRDDTAKEFSLSEYTDEKFENLKSFSPDRTKIVQEIERLAFIEGAKWADQNPSPEVQQIIEALEEANNMYADYFADIDGTAEILKRNEELIETYRKSIGKE
jgi:hypothetical protein